MFRRIRLMAPFLTIALLVLVSALPAKAGGPIQSARFDEKLVNITEITSTIDGQRRAVEAARRFAAQGFVTTVDKLKTFRLADNQYLVVPADMVEDLLATGPSGRPVLSSPKRPLGTTERVSPLSESWSQVAGECWESTKEATTLDLCYKMSKYSGTILSGGSQKDVYALHTWVVGTGGYYGSTAQKLYQTWLKASRHPESASMTWADWNPKSNTTGNCRPYSISFSTGGISVGTNGEICEAWKVTRMSNPGEMISTWSHGGRGTLDPRENALGVEVYVPVGGWPRWNFNAQWWWYNS